ncbi:hypothetical protein COO60DRAFT_1457746 [Scenedesmus sp. NREL 46B-D3]|nr:hypothetical protein COO60DRAFT_1457746 [Scenedesmus sp. NREL 46B-D3]
MVQQDGATVGLRELLYHALNEGPIYSAVVPWVLDGTAQAPSLSIHVQQRQVLQQYQLQLALEQCCSHACSINVDECSSSGGAAPDGDDQQLRSTPSSSCALSAPATRLAKLHGHMLAHGMLPNLAEQLHMLVLLLTSGPLLASSVGSRSGSGSKGTPAGDNSTAQRVKDRTANSTGGKQQQPSTGKSRATAAAAAGSCKPAVPVSSPEQLLCCRACAARCSSRLEGLRQQQAAAAGLDSLQQRTSAAAVATTELHELLSELSVAAKQLLLQLAPGNQGHLAELFTACVLQAASSGEPILEPQLAMMAQREPGKFHKLQQRLADGSAGLGTLPGPGLLQPAGAAATAKQAPLKTGGSADRGAFNPSVASHASVAAALQQLQLLQALPCMSPTHGDFGRLPACLSSCLAGCQLLQDAGSWSSQQHDAGTASQQQQQPACLGDLSPAASQLLCRVVADGSAFVDDAFWTVCSPGLQQLTGLLAESSAEATRQQQQGRGNQPADSRAARDPNSSAASAAGAGEACAGSRRAATCKQGALPAAANSSAPALGAPPQCLAAALAAVGDPMAQQLQQAFIAQYSTDDNPVKMRDVLSLVNSILCANSLALALSEGVPGVLQQHLEAMQQQVTQQLAPAGQGGTAAAQLQDQALTRAVHAACAHLMVLCGCGSTLSSRACLQDLARAVHSICAHLTVLCGCGSTRACLQDLARAVHAACAQHSLPAIQACLESAMQRAAAHAVQAAAAACASLLPAQVPAAASAAAAALLAACCKASCAQGLLQEAAFLFLVAALLFLVAVLLFLVALPASLDLAAAALRFLVAVVALRFLEATAERLLEAARFLEAVRWSPTAASNVGGGESKVVSHGQLITCCAVTTQKKFTGEGTCRRTRVAAWGSMQRLWLLVPVLVQSQLADQADDLVRILTRQWAAHQRMTAAPGSASAPAGSTTSSGRQPAAVQGSQRSTAVPQQAPDAPSGAGGSPAVQGRGAGRQGLLQMPAAAVRPAMLALMGVLLRHVHGRMQQWLQQTVQGMVLHQLQMQF